MPFSILAAALATLTSWVSCPDSPAIESFDWDYLGRPLLRTRGPAKWTTAWSSGAGTTTTPVSDTLVRQYDGRGRLAQMSVTNAASPTDLIGATYAYAGDDQPLAVSETRGSGNVLQTFTYDPDRGLVASIARGTDTVSYAYNADDTWASVTSPNGTTRLRAPRQLRGMSEWIPRS